MHLEILFSKSQLDKEKFTNGTYNRQSPIALGDHAARQLANATKTVPQLSTITPRWLTHLLAMVAC
jgi:hypothetical protein